MSYCSYCGSSLLFKGINDGPNRYCNESSRSNMYSMQDALSIPDADAVIEAESICSEKCPKCGADGPIEFHSSYFIWSLLLMTQWQTITDLTCKSCARKSNIKFALASAAVGWWGFPWGIIVTPVQIIRNIGRIFTNKKNVSPSRRMLNEAKWRLYIKCNSDSDKGKVKMPIAPTFSEST